MGPGGAGARAQEFGNSECRGLGPGLVQRWLQCPNQYALFLQVIFSITNMATVGYMEPLFSVL